MNVQGKDLSKEAPASAGKRTGGYVIVARMADKARAHFLGGNLGDYHTDCPLDHLLLDWKGVPYAEIKQQILDGATDEDLAAYLNAHGTPKTPDEVAAWSDDMVNMNPYDHPEKRRWYENETRQLGLDPATTPMFTWLDADDRASHGK